MAKLFVTFTAVLVVVAYHYSDALPTVSPVLSTTTNSNPLVDPKCDAALQKATKTCNETAQATWTKSKVHQEMIEAEKKGDKVKLEKLQTQLLCCSTWDLIHCTELGTGDKCSEKDYQLVWVLLEWGKTELEKQKCQDYSYSDRKVKCIP